MNQQFDLQNITDAVLKAVKSTGQEENVSAENIAKQVAEILKNNNTKINTFDSFDTDSLNNEKKFVEEEPKPLSGSFTLEEPPKTVEEVDTRDIDVPLNGSFGIKRRAVDIDINSTVADNKANVQGNTDEISEKSSDEVINNKAYDVDNVTEKSTANEQNSGAADKTVESRPVDMEASENSPVEEHKPLSGSFTLEEPPKAVEEVDTRDIDVPLNGSFGINRRAVDIDINSTVADNKANVQGNTDEISEKSSDEVINNKAYDVDNVTEKSTANEQNSGAADKTVESKPIDMETSENSPTEKHKPLSGSFTLEEPPKTVEEVDTRDIDVPLNGSFGINRRAVDIDINSTVADNKANVQGNTDEISEKSSDEVINNKAYDVDNVTEKSTANEQNSGAADKTVESKPVDTETSENSPVEKHKPLSGSFTLEKPPKTVEEVDTRDIDVPLNGSFDIKIKDINKIEKSTSKTKESTTSFSDNVKIDADDNKILEAAKKIIIDYIATEEFANKLKEILK